MAQCETEKNLSISWFLLCWRYYLWDTMFRLLPIYNIPPYFLSSYSWVPKTLLFFRVAGHNIILFSSELVFQTYVWVFAFVFLITFFIFSHFNCFIYLTLFGQLEQDSILDSDWLRATMRPRYRTLIGWEWYDVFPIFV